MVTPECEWCGAKEGLHRSNHAGWLCDDVAPCLSRGAERFDADEWYAAEVERLKDQAPA